MSYTLIMISQEPHDEKVPNGIEYLNVITPDTEPSKAAVQILKALKDVKTAYTLILTPGSTYPTSLPENDTESLLYGNSQWLSSGAIIQLIFTRHDAAIIADNPGSVSAAFMLTEDLKASLTKTIGMPNISPLHVAYYTAFHRKKAKYISSLNIVIKGESTLPDVRHYRTKEVIASLFRL